MTKGELQSGIVIGGRYRLLEPIGEGARKRTWRALDTKLERVVALSIVKEGLAGPAAVRRREVHALGQVGDHDNIVPLYDLGEQDGFEYLVFAYFNRGTLERYVRTRQEREKPLSEVELMRLGRQLARALSHLHERKLVHRDVAPCNIWLDERNEAHLGDLDSTVRVEAQREPPPLSPTTLDFASPELRDGHPVDARSDRYSLGAVLFWAATGETPPLSDPLQARRRLVRARPDLPLAFRSAICALLDPDPAARPADVQDLIDRVMRPLRDAAIEALPFPLACILWRADSEADPKDRVALLLHFFEALAQLRATILLAALLRDSELLGDDPHGRPWPGGDGAAHSFERASFGTWVAAGEQIATHWRALLDDDHPALERVSACFAIQGLEPVQRLCAGELTALLRQTCEWRNDWQGHGGLADPDTLRERLRLIEGARAKALRCLGGVFDSWQLVLPLAARGSEGNWLHRSARLLTGANAAFRARELGVAQPLATHTLHMVEDGNRYDALPLPALMRLIPDDPAEGPVGLYFYSRIEPSGAISYISYQGDVSERVECSDEELRSLLLTLPGYLAALTSTGARMVAVAPSQRPATADARGR